MISADPSKRRANVQKPTTASVLFGHQPGFAPHRDGAVRASLLQTEVVGQAQDDGVARIGVTGREVADQPGFIV